MFCPHYREGLLALPFPLCSYLVTKTYCITSIIMSKSIIAFFILHCYYQLVTITFPSILQPLPLICPYRGLISTTTSFTLEVKPCWRYPPHMYTAKIKKNNLDLSKLGFITTL